MSALTTVQLKIPYLILIGDQDDPNYAKTGIGIVQWRRELVAGQLRFPGCKVDLGVADLTVEEAAEAGVGSLLVGVATVGGTVPDEWWQVMEQAARAGMDVVCGLHTRLKENPAIVAAAESSGARLVDVREPPPNLPVGTGLKRSGKRILMVGTDCAVGKKWSALALHRAMRDAGMKATFRATGQTGIMIAGEGIAVDAVVADFISGAAETLSPDNDEDHWDVIEGQGSLAHPAYSGVALGLLHGSQPDAFVLCHEAGRTTVAEWDHFDLPSIDEFIEMNLRMGARTNPDIRCVGLSVNTSSLNDGERRDYLAGLSAETGLPCVDPLIDGCAPIVDCIRDHLEGDG